MRGLVVIAAVLLQSCLCYGRPEGVGAFAYQDSTGNRYGGTYGLKDGQVVDVKGDYPPPEFAPHNFQDLEDFFPEYFRNFEYLIQEAFGSDSRGHDLAFTAAHKAFDLASNQVGYMPNFDFRFNPFGGFAGRGGAPPFDMFPNSAFASAASAPGVSRHIAAINPGNPNMPNVDKTYRSANIGGRDGGYQSVSSSSFSSSSNVNGRRKDYRLAETLTNNNGMITHHRVES